MAFTVFSIAFLPSVCMLRLAVEGFHELRLGKFDRVGFCLDIFAFLCLCELLSWLNNDYFFGV